MAITTPQEFFKECSKQLAEWQAEWENGTMLREPYHSHGTNIFPRLVADGNIVERREWFDMSKPLGERHQVSWRKRPYKGD